MKKALVCGAGGFIGSHLVRRLKRDGFWVRGIDIKFPEFSQTEADDFVSGDLRDISVCRKALNGGIDEVYQLAADMGGAGYIFTGSHDADIMHNSAQINLNMAPLMVEAKVGRVFYSSSACIYPQFNQEDPLNPLCSEESAYPAFPDSEYGWEKLFSERMYQSFYRNYGLQVRIARFHNIFGPEGTWESGKEKAVAALCRKVILEPNGGAIQVWGSGSQTRSFLFIDECLDGVRRLVDSDFIGPVNIGSEEMISINDLAKMIISISGKDIQIENVPGPVGVQGRNSDNRLIKSKLAWAPSLPLVAGVEKTYRWIEQQVKNRGVQ